MRGVLNYQLSSIFRMVHTRYKLCVHVTPLFDCFLSYNVQLRTCPAYSRVMQESGSSPAPASTITTLHNAAFVVLFIFNFPHVAISLWSHLVHQQCKLHFKVRWCGYSRVPCRHSDSVWRNLRPSHNCILSPPRPPHTAQYWRANNASIPPPLATEGVIKVFGSFHKIQRSHFKDLF